MSLDFISYPVSILQGDIHVLGDKSISHRAILLGAIADGTTTIHGFLPGEDCLATLKAFQSMGVHIEGPMDSKVIVHGVGKSGLKAPPAPIDCGNSGTTMRLLTGLLAAQSFDSVLIGDDSLSKRPMARVSDPLKMMGASIQTTDGHAPLFIQGGKTLKGIDYEMPIASAQVKSALLLAGLYAEGETTVIESIVSRDHTERMFATLGYPLKKSGPALTVNSGFNFSATEIRVPGDLSSAAFFIVAATIVQGSNLIIREVGINPTRTGLLTILNQMGADIRIINQQHFGEELVADIHVQYAPLKGIDIPSALVPLAIDEFPIIFIAAATAEGKTTLRGARELRTKESDRLGAMVEGLLALGIKASTFEDGLSIEGGKIQGGVVHSHHDHRIAMAFSIAGAVASGPVIIRDCANVATSFPTFLETANQLQMHIKKTNFQHPPVITLDGPSGTGKGTICHQVAKYLGWHILDSGAIYRVLAYAIRQKGISFDDEAKMVELARGLQLTFGSDVHQSSQVMFENHNIYLEIRTEQCAQDASKIAAIPAIRDALLDRQRAFATFPGLVTDGRDMGTVVFPDAILKIYLDASPEERAKRRYFQLKEKGINVSLAKVVEELAQRDERDSARSCAPLKLADDAVCINTTGLSVVQVFTHVLKLVESRLNSI